MVAQKPLIFVFTTAYAPFFGGAELAVQEISRRLASDFEFIFITARMKRMLQPIEKLGEGVVYRAGVGFGALDKVLLPFTGALLARSIMKKHQGSQFLFWGVMISYASIGAFFLKYLFPHVPFVLTLQEGNREWEHAISARWWKILLRSKKINHVTAISNFLKDTARVMGYKGTISLIPNGVDDTLLEIAPHDSPWWSDHHVGVVTIFSASRLVYKNGIDILLRAVSRLKAEFNFKIILAGDGALRSSLERQADELDLKDNIVFLGSVPHDELPRLYKDADIFVRPSRSEGLGSAFLEAMAAGLVTVGTSVGGITDFLVDGKTGFVARPEDVESCMRAIQRACVLKNNERRALVESVRRMVKDRFLWDYIAGEMKNVFLNMHA